MTSTFSAELCRITVVGPDGRVDLAVPMTTTVATLLPILVQHTVQEPLSAAFGSTSGGSPDTLPGDAAADSSAPPPDTMAGVGARSWVLQRLGGPPLDPDGTPETLDWFEGEQLHLRPAGNPLPELDFDDVADGMATAVDRQRNHWRPEHTRPLFLSLTAVVVATIFWSMFQSPSGTVATIVSSVLALVFAVASVSAARWREDGALATLSGLTACGFAAIAGLVGLAGPDHALALRATPVVIAAVCATGVAGLLLGARYSVADAMPVVPFGVIVLCGVTLLVCVWLHKVVEFTPEQTAALVSSVFFVGMIYSPKIAIRLARLRGPQLPRTAKELQIGIEPAPAGEILARTAFADRYLNVITMSGSLVYVVSFPYLLDLPGWIRIALPVVFVAAVALRARHFVGLQQRLAVVAGATAGVVFVVADQVEGMSLAHQLIVLVVLLAAIVSLVLAATRPAVRRLLPIWGHLGNIAETATAVAVLPLLLQVLGVYAWARGLAG